MALTDLDSDLGGPQQSLSSSGGWAALLTAARDSTNDNDFALVAMLGLLGLRIFEATSSSIEDLGEEHGHRVLRVHALETMRLQGSSEPEVKSHGIGGFTRSAAEPAAVRQ